MPRQRRYINPVSLAGKPSLFYREYSKTNASITGNIRSVVKSMLYSVANKRQAKLKPYQYSEV